MHKNKDSIKKFIEYRKEGRRLEECRKNYKEGFYKSYQ